MKFYTKPRQVYPPLLIPGDQVAVMPDGQLVHSLEEWIDTDLTEDGVRWSVVHHVSVAADDDDLWDVTHTTGMHRHTGGCTLIMREVLEIDPWSYVRT